MLVQPALAVSVAFLAFLQDGQKVEFFFVHGGASCQYESEVAKSCATFMFF
jgi:hypothetical protein